MFDLDAWHAQICCRTGCKMQRFLLCDRSSGGNIATMHLKHELSLCACWVPGQLEHQQHVQQQQQKTSVGCNLQAITLQPLYSIPPS
jgi:hypothetical protein